MFKLARSAPAVLLSAQLLWPPALVLAASEDGTVVGSYAASDASSALATAQLKSSTAKATQQFDVPVSAQGSFSTRVPIVVPPGRLSMTPGLALQYDSARRTTSSPVGAGFTLGHRQIERSTRHGFYALTRNADGSLHYSDTGAFVVDGETLVPVTRGAVPEPQTSDGVFYVLERSEPLPTLYEYSAQSDAWVAHTADGGLTYFGEGPSTPPARVVTELGTVSWQHVVTVDKHHNHISYRYHFSDDALRSDRLSPSRAPLLAEVGYGGNLATGQAHPFRVVVSLAHADALDAPRALEGNTFAAGQVARIDVCGPMQKLPTSPDGVLRTLDLPTHPACGTQWHYRGYALLIESSTDTGRPLLSAVTESSPDTTPRTTTFAYASNNGTVRFAAAQPLVPGNFDASLALVRLHGTEAMGTESAAQGMAHNPGNATAARLLDISGDGQVDIVHHPASVTGVATDVFYHATPTITLMQPQPTQLRPYGVDVPRSFGGLGGGRFAVPPVLPDEPLALGEAEPLTQRVRDELVDVNGDGLVDGIYFQQQTGAPLPPPASSEPCFTDTFWRQCGALPPAPENAVDWTQCNDAECYLSPSQFADVFVDVRDWAVTPPLSDSGREALAEMGVRVVLPRGVIVVPRALLNGRVDVHTASVAELKPRLPLAQPQRRWGSAAPRWRCAAMRVLTLFQVHRLALLMISWLSLGPALFILRMPSICPVIKMHFGRTWVWFHQCNASVWTLALRQRVMCRCCRCTAGPSALAATARLWGKPSTGR